jgi:hypothetical protein
MPKKIGGYLQIVDPDPGRGQSALTEHDTLKCCHCGANFYLVTPHKTNMGTVPGTCWSCGGGPVCGPKCANHVPEEIQLLNLEAGLPADTVSTRVSVPSLWLP